MTREIIYIAFTGKDHVGVLKKIIGQIEMWRSCNYKVTLVTDIDTKSKLIKYTTRYFILFKYFVVRKNHDTAIYMRQTPQLPLYASILKYKKFSCEVNADIKTESNNYSTTRKLFALFFPQNIHNISSSTFYVSLELAQRMHQSSGPAYVFPNSLRTRPMEHALPRTHNVVFVGTPEYAWQGFDLFFSIAQAMPAYKFHVIGASSGPTNNNLKYHGALLGEEYKKIMSKMDFAVGTLAFHRAGIIEGSPLKVRDYVEFNLPFVISYVDSDFSQLDFCLRINTEILTQEIYKVENFFDFWRNRSIKISDDAPFLNANREPERARLIIET